MTAEAYTGPARGPRPAASHPASIFPLPIPTGKYTPPRALPAPAPAFERGPVGIATPVANAVAEIRTELSPVVLMQKLLEVENQLDRVRKPGEEGHGPRTIDCDLEWIEGERHAGKKLTLPHARMGERDYVILPMEDLMHDPARFFAYANAPVKVMPREQRVGMVMTDLGELTWE